MTLRDRLAQMRLRLRHCNILVVAFVVTLVGMWDELKPLVQDFLSGYISPQNVGLVMTGLGILAIFIRAGAAIPVQKDEEPR